MGNNGKRKIKRWHIQLITTLATNPFWRNFKKGTIHRGNSKTVCVPGLNCYSCPAAAGACPIGALQAVIGSSSFRFSYYIVGSLIFIGVTLGRVVCGFFCPFGWFQELLHKIPSKKFSSKKLRYLTGLKYVVLILFVFVLPVTVVNEVGMGNPFFCKYLCPAGILEGGLPLSIVNSGIRASLGWLFTWKSCILLAVILLSVFFYRPFCKWLCPLGAFYSLFNRISLYRLDIDKEKCSSCELCSRKCPMDVDVLHNPNAVECIRCGKCVAICPNDAIYAGFIKLKKKD